MDRWVVQVRVCVCVCVCVFAWVCVIGGEAGGQNLGSVSQFCVLGCGDEGKRVCVCGKSK